MSIEGHGHYLTLAQIRVHTKIQTAFSQKFCMKAFRYKEMKIWLHDAGHMTKMAAMPIYGKTLQKSSSPEAVDRFSRNLVCSIGDPGVTLTYFTARSNLET